MVFALLVAFSLLGTLGSVAGAALILLAGRQAQRWIRGLVSFATGTLLGATFLALLPGALRLAPAEPILTTVLAGLLLFFLLERILLWRHSHDDATDSHGVPGHLILVGDSFHNLIDGIVIAAGFLTSAPLGITTALATAAHEVPQEVSDFTILLHSGWSRGQALFWNVLSALVTLPAAVAAYLLLPRVKPVLPYLLAVAAASFLYIALADLVPSLHRRTGLRAALLQILLLLAGIGLVVVFAGG